MTSQQVPTPSRHRVVVIGSGFGGLFGTQALKRADVDVTLIAKTTHHLFQPLLYQVATGILSEGEIAPATREVLARQRNARVLLGNVTHIDLAAKTVTSRVLDRDTVTALRHPARRGRRGPVLLRQRPLRAVRPGHEVDRRRPRAPRPDLRFVRVGRAASTPKEIERLMTFVVVGAGPTGGGDGRPDRRAVPSHAAQGLPQHRHQPGAHRAAGRRPAVLAAFGDQLGAKAAKRLAEIGVEVQLGAKVTGVDATGIDVEDADGTQRRIESVCKVWAAGVQASELGAQLAEQSGAQLDRAGRVAVNDDLTLPGHPEVFVVGDMASLKGYPGVAQVAIQGSRYAAEQIKRRLAGKEPKGPFEYHDKGSMATISRFSAVASIGNLRFTGFVAWLLWLAVHLVYIIGFKHRLTTLLHWAVSFLGRGRSERTVTEQQVFARTAIEQLARATPRRCHGSRRQEGSGPVRGPGARRGQPHPLSRCHRARCVRCRVLGG